MNTKMKTFSWNDIKNSDGLTLFPQGTGISVGCFDGIHLGHRTLLKVLVDECAARKLTPLIITFSKPLPGIKHTQDYMGDLCTLNHRLELFEQLGIYNVVIVDFDDDFAHIPGTEFLLMLKKCCNMRFIAEGIDFRCGYKGATDNQAIRYFCQQNDVGLQFVNPVYFREGTDEEERVSSSFIRQMIQKGFFLTVNELLARPYELRLERDAAVHGTGTDTSSGVGVGNGIGSAEGDLFSGIETGSATGAAGTELSAATGSTGTISSVVTGSTSVSTGSSGGKENLTFNRSDIKQVLPAAGIYHCRNKKDDDVRLEITTDSIIVYDVTGPEDLALRFSS